MNLNITITRPVLRLIIALLFAVLLCGVLTLWVPWHASDGVKWQQDLPHYSMPWSNSSPFYPSELKTTDGKMVNWRSVPSATFCAECHIKEYKEWASSIHAISGSDLVYNTTSLQNEFSSKTAGALATEKIRWCDGCHEPMGILSGEASPLAAVGPNEALEEGASCIVCHTAVEARPLVGNAGLTLNVNEIKRYLDPALIMAAPEQHAKSMQAKRHNPMMGRSEMCGTCHTEIRPDRINGDFPLHFQETFDEWRLSEYADRGIECQDCHMDADPASYVAALKRGEQPKRKMSHRFVGNNYLMTESDLPQRAFIALRGGWVPGRNVFIDGDEWLADLKKQQGLIVNLLQQAADIEVIADPVAAGESLPIQLQLTNSGAGHSLPTGPLDQRYMWLEVKVTDNSGNILLHSGWFDQNTGEEDPDAVKYLKIMHDQDGQENRRHVLFDVERMRYSRKPIRPLETDIIDYQLQLPQNISGSLQLEVRLWYRIALQDILQNVVDQDPLQKGLFKGVIVPPIPMLEVIREVKLLPQSGQLAGTGEGL